MELTGKAKKEFVKWLSEQGVNGIDISNFEFDKFHLLSKVCQNALIIEWFDSVGIYVNVLKYGLSESNKWVISKSLCENNLDFMYSSRSEATIQAIIKANEIYNERFK